LTPGANGTWTETVLYSFSGADGYSPSAGLIMDVSGNLYGTTVAGGASGTGCRENELSYITAGVYCPLTP
jgi:hypothetical protein